MLRLKHIVKAASSFKKHVLRKKINKRCKYPLCALIYIGFGKINKRIRQLQKLVIFASLFHLPAVINVPEIIFFLVCKSVVRSTNIDSFLKKNFVAQSINLLPITQRILAVDSVSGVNVLNFKCCLK